jgi:hypothetical protein
MPDTFKFDPATMDDHAVYRLLIGSVVHARSAGLRP